MSYSSMNDMRMSASLTNRIIACVASLGDTQPEGWAYQYMWHFSTIPAWAEAWQLAKDGQTSDYNPDIGARESVITDEMILSAVQELRAVASPE